MKKKRLTDARKLRLGLIADALRAAEEMDLEIQPLLAELEIIMGSDAGKRLSEIQARLDELRPKYIRALNVAGHGLLCDTRDKKK